MPFMPALGAEAGRALRAHLKINTHTHINVYKFYTKKTSMYDKGR